MDPERRAHIAKLFRGELQRFRELLLMMAGIADRNMTMALKSLVEMDENIAKGVISEDSQLDELEKEVDEFVVGFLCTRGPMATECRMMMAGSKISGSLERIGDQSVTIARRARLLLNEYSSDLESIEDVKKMTDIALRMLRSAIEAFIEIDPDKAREVGRQDKSVDEIRTKVEQDMLEHIMASPAASALAVNMVIISRGVERVADYAQNIAEDVYFLYTGHDIRHENPHSTPH